MSTVNVQVPEDELQAFEAYASANNCSLPEIFMIALTERMEYESDLRDFAEYKAQKESGTLTTRPIEKFWEDVGL